EPSQLGPLHGRERADDCARTHLSADRLRGHEGDPAPGAWNVNALITLEEQGWNALATEGDAGRQFYAAVLRDDAVMLFPGGMRIEGRDSILESLGAQPWGTFTIEDARVVPLAPD